MTRQAATQGSSMMTPHEFAATLSGATYPETITREQARVALMHGLVVVFGASDDLMELRGAIYDELGAYNGTTAYLTPAGLLLNDCENEDCPHFAKLKPLAATIDALWDDGSGYSWRFRTSIPHATFVVMEDGEPYCEGIVFALADAAKDQP